MEPLDDEHLSDEEIQRLEEGRKYFAEGGRGISMEEVLAEYGLTLENFPSKQ